MVVIDLTLDHHELSPLPLSSTRIPYQTPSMHACFRIVLHTPICIYPSLPFVYLSISVSALHFTPLLLSEFLKFSVPLEVSLSLSLMSFHTNRTYLYINMYVRQVSVIYNPMIYNWQLYVFFHSHQDGTGRHRAVLDVYGSTGGLAEYRAAMLASRGFTSFALAWALYDDLPPGIHVQYDYFLVRTFRWADARKT